MIAWIDNFLCFGLSRNWNSRHLYENSSIRSQISGCLRLYGGGTGERVRGVTDDGDVYCTRILWVQACPVHSIICRFVPCLSLQDFKIETSQMFTRNVKIYKVILNYTVICQLDSGALFDVEICAHLDGNEAYTR
ncbi:hypothetical protein LOAG_14581 [Loa loa]|uniref:Uncharacterized protein n=1 Tax=Loa loa TaxID=7209 RepID=A0A1S0THL8_LOALO|nr:hypothetical protein LOAG_14581 [Loa loa]EFO13945.1 hypothetical protein LOAG_14581 [Loa loa]